MGNTKAATAEPAEQKMDATIAGGDSVLARIWPAAIAARVTRPPTAVEMQAAAEFQQIKAELRTNFE